MVVKELLKLLITKVDANLLKGVELEDLKTSNIQHSNEIDFLHGGINEGPVAEVNKPEEEPIVHGPSQGSNRVETVVSILTLVDPLCANFDLGTDEVTIEELPVLNSTELANILAGHRVIHLAGLFTTLLLEGHLTQVENGCG